MVAFNQTEAGNHLQNEEWQDCVPSRRKVRARYYFHSALGAHTVPMTIALLTVQWLSSQKRGMQ